VSIPLHRLVVVTGVSGSGKSTLARDVLLTNAAAAVAQRNTRSGREAWDAGERPAWTGCGKLLGTEHIARVLEVDQTPIGKTPRSCPATYIGFWDDIRRLFAGTLEAQTWPTWSASSACCIGWWTAGTAWWSSNTTWT
jgi:excinuclease ABC subunit A